MADLALDGTISRDQQSSAAMNTFSNIAEAWGLTTEQQIVLLGSPGRSTFFKWKKEGGQIPTDTFERISHIVSIYKCLNILFPNARRSDEWIKRPNAFFVDESALDWMLRGKMADIIDVRRYLDAQRGG